MTTFVPDSGRLLQAAVDYLDVELLSTLDGYHRFHLRVCINALRIVSREMAQGTALEQGEQQRLERLLGRAGTLDDLNAELTARIDSGALPLATPGLAGHLQATLRDALAINNLAWIAPR